MADRVCPEKRSEIMRAVRSKNTAPEVIVRKAAHKLGLRFRLHGNKLPGKPDLVFPRWRIAIFVNGCFWHRHHGCSKATTPKTNTAFWGAKFAANIERDRKNYELLSKYGWRVIIIWQCEVPTSQHAEKLLATAFNLDTTL